MLFRSGTYQAAVIASASYCDDVEFTVDVDVEVIKNTPDITTKPSATSITYGQTLSESTLSGGVASVNGSFAWRDSSLVLTAGTHNVNVRFSPTDSTNYETKDITIFVIVKKATPSILTNPIATAVTYPANVADSVLSGGSATVPGTFTWINGTQTVVAGTNSHLVTFTPTDSVNYNSVTASVPLITNKNAPTITEKPSVTIIKYIKSSAVRITKVKNKKQYVKLTYSRLNDVDGYEIQYSNKKNFKKKWVLNTTNKKVKITRKALIRKSNQGVLSVSFSKKSRISAMIGMKYLNKKVKINRRSWNKNSKIFMHLRAYKLVNGKKIYSKWSSTVKTKSYWNS